ncbi:MAG: glycerol-3-phosphate 1-O-acyltransferase PlsY [Ilumatobacteraceae bacterium]
MTTAALILAAYFIGMFPSAVIVARASGVDITTAGSGNPGASNVTRVLGWKRGVVVFALDAAKGALSAGAGWAVVGLHVGYFCAAAATIGHMYPVLVRYGGRRLRGGKGVATAGGAMFVLQPIVAAVLLATWFAVSRLTKKASLASIVIIVLLPIGAAAFGAPAWEIIAIVLLGAIVMLKHTANIKRLIRRQELTIGDKTEP